MSSVANRKVRRVIAEILENRTLLAADLSGYYCTPTGTPAWGGTVTVLGRVRNTGTTDVTATFYQRFYLSNDEVFGDADDVLLNGVYTHSADVLANGYGPDFSVDVVLPAYRPVGYFGGDFFIGMKTDADDNVAESNESNNFGTERITDYEAISIPEPQLNIVFAGTEGDDVISVRVAGDAMRGTVNGVPTDYPVGDVRSISIEAQGGNDTVSVSGNVPLAVTIVGGDGNDSLQGGDYADLMSGGGGDDWLAGLAGKDSISGEQGNDTIYGGWGVDSITGGDGADLVYAGRGNDSVEGGAGRDTLVGDNNDDLLWGNDDADLLNGGYGNDTISGDAGADQLIGNDGSDTLSGGPENDTLYGGYANDYLYGDDGNDWLFGGRGNDTLEGGFGTDVLLGEGDDDWLYAWDGARDMVRGDAGMDHTWYDAIDSLLDPIEDAVRM